jgi:hypothetical protein
MSDKKLEHRLEGVRVESIRTKGGGRVFRVKHLGSGICLERTAMAGKATSRQVDQILRDLNQAVEDERRIMDILREKKVSPVQCDLPANRESIY